MKKIAVILLLLAGMVSVFSCRKKGETPLGSKLDAALIKDTTVIEFIDSSTYTFDTINEGDKVETSFRLRNMGDKNLLIANAIPTCGCTVPEFPREPLKPGDTATIKVTFNSSGKRNEQLKTVTLVCNTLNREERLFLKGYVIPNEKD